MQTLARYVLGEYLLVFALSLCATTLLMLFVAMSLDLPKDIGSAEILLILPYLVPEAVRNAMQAAALFAACCVFGRLAASNELLALSSLGVSPIQVIRPVLLLGVLLSVICVWLYDVGEAWAKRQVQEVLINAAETIAYRNLRSDHHYTRGRLSLSVKGVEGRTLIRPTLIMETSDGPGPLTVSAAEGELRNMGRQRGLSIVVRNGTASIGDQVSMAFPDTMEQVISLTEAAGPQSNWPLKNQSLADLETHIEDEQARLERALHRPRFWRRAPTQPQDVAVEAAPAPTDPGSTRMRLHWLRAQVNRRWANGFFCLAFVMVGVPVSMRVRSRDFLTSFFACFLPIVLFNHPLHNFCIKLAQAGKGPPALPWLGDFVLIGVGVWLLSKMLRH